MTFYHLSVFLNLIKIAIKIGPPISDVKIPIGNSEGATIVLLIVSANNNRMLPQMADNGKMK